MRFCITAVPCGVFFFFPPRALPDVIVTMASHKRYSGASSARRARAESSFYTKKKVVASLFRRGANRRATGVCKRCLSDRCRILAEPERTNTLTWKEVDQQTPRDRRNIWRRSSRAFRGGNTYGRVLQVAFAVGKALVLVSASAIAASSMAIVIEHPNPRKSA
ncbi:uncharacterized protein BDZ83DRAFT_390688 [Colletotrichum acutatum]|uniref:Uncharacterized protein n=1 Tax=Glomerella acutata TaxID=27357 RepID=A0AAD8XHB8_GLOAC|nr:uncharacterized protein BDZ83DRAFT_390688 [Colletotrichum acutatum]KAK1723345.1 hypothetical protein BDZ83DRAFT_390688 [Colletotrichum acutatum]